MISCCQYSRMKKTCISSVLCSMVKTHSPICCLQSIRITGIQTVGLCHCFHTLSTIKYTESGQRCHPWMQGRWRGPSAMKIRDASNQSWLKALPSNESVGGGSSPISSYWMRTVCVTSNPQSGSLLRRK